MDNNISDNLSESVTIVYENRSHKQINKSDIKDFDSETISKISAQSIVQYIDLFNPICLINAFASVGNDTVYYEVNNVQYNDTDKLAKYISELETKAKEEICNRFLDADVLYTCFLDNDFVKKISSNKQLFDRIKNELVAKISDDKNSDAIRNFMRYIRQRYDYNDESRFTYVNLALETFKSVDVALFFKEEIDKNGKTITRFKNKGYEDFLYYLLDIINISGIKSLNLFAKKYADNESSLQKITSFILKLNDGFIAEKSCLSALFRIFPKIASVVYKTDPLGLDHGLYAQCLINFINSDNLTLFGLTRHYFEHENENGECVAKFLADQIKNGKIKGTISNLKDRKDIERVWHFIQEYYGNKNGNDYLGLVDNFANDLIKKGETSALISIPAIFFDKYKLDNITKNLILKTKDADKIIGLIESVEYETAKLFLDFILGTESDVKQNFEDELCKISFKSWWHKRSNLMDYFSENMNLPKCQNVLKKLASNKDGKYKDDDGNLIDSFYNYLIDKKKIARQESDNYFINLIKEEKNVIKFICDMDFCMNNIDNQIVKESFSNAPIKRINLTLGNMNSDIKYFRLDNLDPVDRQLGKEKFMQKRGLYVYELMMRPDIFEILPVAEYEKNGYLKSKQNIIGTEVWEVFTQALKLKIENRALEEAERKNISNKEWFSYVFAKMLDSVKKLRTEMEETEHDWLKSKNSKELLRLSSILCDFVSAVYKVAKNKDELYDMIWDKIKCIPYDFFLQQTPEGNFNFRHIIYHKAKLSQEDKNGILKKARSAYKIETDKQGKETLVFNENLSEEEVNIIKKKTGHEYVVTVKDGKEEIVFNTDENGKLVKKEYKSDPQSFWFWLDIQDFLEQREIWKRKNECYFNLDVINEKYIFLFDLEDLSEIMVTEKDNCIDLEYIKTDLLLHLNDKFEGTHSGFFGRFKKQPTDNLTMADWLIYRLAYGSESAKDDFCCNLINLIYKDFDKYVRKQKGSNTKYQLIDKFISQISEEYLRDNLFSTKNNTLKNIINDASKKNDALFFKLCMSCLNKLKYDTQNNHERENFLNLFSMCPSEIINHVDVNFIFDNLDNNCVWKNLKHLPEKCKNKDGAENENHKKIRLICENKNFDRICKTQEEYWLKLIEFGPRDIIGYLDWKFIYRNLDKKLVQDHLKYINWSIVFKEDNSLDKIMKFIAQEEKFYTPDMEHDLNNIFWQNFKHVKDDPINNYKFLFLLNIYPEAMRNIDISFLAENLLDENIFDMEFLKTNLFHIGGEDRIKNLCEYIEKNELDPENKKNKLMLLIDSSIFAECLVYIDCDDSLINFLTEKIESNVANKYLSLCSGQKTNSIYQSIAKSDIDENKKIKILKMILCRISEEALDYLITRNVINQNIKHVFHGQPGNYMLSAGRRCVKDDGNMTDLIKTSLKKFTVQKKKYDRSPKKQNKQNQIVNDLNLKKNVISDDKNKNNGNIIQDNLTMNQNSIVNNSNENNNLIKTTQHQNVLITDRSNINLNQQNQSQINTLEFRNLATSNNSNNKLNASSNNKKTRIWLIIIGLIFIIAGICLCFTAPKIAIISLVIGGLLFIGAIGFNKFRSCLCFNKSQIENSEFEQKQQSIDERINNVQAKQMPGNNEINNGAPLI